MKIVFLRDSLLFFCFFGLASLLGFSQAHGMRAVTGVIDEYGRGGYHSDCERTLSDHSGVGGYMSFHSDGHDEAVYYGRACCNNVHYDGDTDYSGHGDARYDGDTDDREHSDANDYRCERQKHLDIDGASCNKSGFCQLATVFEDMPEAVSDTQCSADILSGLCAIDTDGVECVIDRPCFQILSPELLCEIFTKLDRQSLVRVASVCKNCASGAQFVLKIQEKERLLKKYDGDMQLGFFDAAARGLTRLLRFLISIEGIDVNGADNFGDAVLFGSVKDGSFTRCAKHETALHYAKDAATVDCLFALGADLNKPNAHGETPLIHATYESNIEKVKKLVELGANLDCRAKKRKLILCEPFGPVIGYDDDGGECTVFEIAQHTMVESGDIKDYLLSVSRRRQSRVRGEDASEKSDF